MLLEKAENNPKSIELIIDTPDFYDYADVQRILLPRDKERANFQIKDEQVVHGETPRSKSMTMEQNEPALGRVYSRDELTMRVKQLSVSKGFKLQTAACRGEGRMIFTCTKSGRSYFHKTAKPEDKVFCPFMLMY